MNKNKQRKFPFQRQTALLLTGALLAGLLPLGTVTKSRAAEQPALRNPRILTDQEVAPGSGEKKELKNPTTDSKGITTWDCIWFGNYWQEDTNGDGKADKNDEKTPIKWRVLSVDGNDVFLLADKNLDCQEYNVAYKDVTWETCTMRSWLNGYGAEANKTGKDYSNNNFLNNAFSADEQSAIKTTNVVNNENPEYDTEGGNDTTDKVYLLSIDEVTDLKYGFESPSTRGAVNTAYSGGHNSSGAMYHDRRASRWWLRSLGYDCNYASDVGNNGVIHPYGFRVSDSFAVRPALHLNLSSDLGWSYAGTVPSDDVAEWDSIWFGNYWQEDTNGDGKADKNDQKTPIKWRVLAVDGDDAFLLADKNLDYQKYEDATQLDVAWEDCTLRSWLNSYGADANERGNDYKGDGFLNYAFTETERQAVKTTNAGGIDTMDQIYLLSADEVTNPIYGFVALRSSTDTRRAVNTVYAADVGSESSSINGAGSADVWWLRSIGLLRGIISYVGFNGNVSQEGKYANYASGVRPALHLDLSSVSNWSYAGTVSSDGKKEEIAAPIVSPGPTERPDSTQKPQITNGPEGTVRPVLPLPTMKPTEKPSSTPSLTEKPQTTFNPWPTIHPPQTLLPPSATAVPVPDGIGAWDNSNVRGLKKGDCFVAWNIKYRVAKLKGKKGEVAVVGVKSKKSKSLVIPQKVKKEGITFTVTSIQKNAFKGCKKAKKLTINSTSIRGITKKAFTGLSKKIQIKIPKSKVPHYWSAFRKLGYSKIDW